MNHVMKIVFVKNIYESRGYCELTDEMDKFLKHGKRRSYRTYMYDFGDRKTTFYDHKEGHVYVMRVPGATRGCIVTNEKDVIDIVMFYEDTCYGKTGCYNPKMEEIKEKYIGRKVVVAYE